MDIGTTSSVEWKDLSSHIVHFDYLLFKTHKSQEGKVHSALPARLLVDDTHAYIHLDCQGGNPVSAPGVGSNVPLVSVDLVDSPKSVTCSPHITVAFWPCDVEAISHEQGHVMTSFLSCHFPL